MKIVFEGIVGSEQVYMDVMIAILGNKRDSLIDLCCHRCSHTPKFRFKKRRYVDILPNVLDFTEEQQYFVQMDVLDTPLDVHYDTAICSDGIEHLTFENGYKLLKIMETISDRQVLFTPFGNMWVGNSGHPEEHASGWTPEMVNGYASIVFPDYHKGWGFGAWFFWRTENIEQNFEVVKNELKNKQWAI